MLAFWRDTLTASKWFGRSLKRGDWLWLMIAVILASSTVTLVKQLGDTVQQSMLRKASESLSADYVIRSSRPIEQKWSKLAIDEGLKTAQSTTLTTMALSNQQFQLVQLKGISDSYPLRGSINQTKDLAFQALQTDQAWVEPKLISLLQLTQESRLTLGYLELGLAGSIQPRALINPMSSFAPQIFITLATLNKTKLIGPGSRVTYELSLAGSEKQITAFAEKIAQQNNPHWQTLSAQAPSEDLGNSLKTAWLFLDLSALSAVLIAGMSILIASRFYLTRWESSMALMRAFGAHNAKMQRLFALQLTWIAMFSSLIGILIGYGLSLLLKPVLADYFQPLIVTPPWSALLTGFLSGILVLWSFAWQAFQTALQTSPMQILKSVPRNPKSIHWLMSFALLLGLISLMFDMESMLWILPGLVTISLILLLAASLLLKGIQKLQHYSRGWFHIALSNLLKEPGLVRIQLVSVGLVLFVLMLMSFVRQDLLQNWQASLPANTPNTFIMNIQPDQESQVSKILANQQLSPPLVPMARGRLIAINQQPLIASEQKSDRARRMLEREANIALLAEIPKYNVVTEEINRDDLTLPRVSVEASMAELFGIQLGDTLSFNFAGQSYDYQVSSLRKVEWQSFRLNFFFILEPVAEHALAFSYISNFHLPEFADMEKLNDKQLQNQPEFATQLTQEFANKTPGVLLIDVRQIMHQIQNIMDQASWAVSGLYLFTLLASIGVLFTATLASQQSRIQSWILLRTLGAQNKEIIKIGLTEFALLGAVAGILAATFAQIASGLLSHYVLKIEVSLDLNLWIISLLSGITLLLLTGLITQYGFLRKSARELRLYLSEQ
ncbi:MAG: FtsX-like permease family protein [Thiomicrorhabdus sp.]|jgi:putative ABC transport system permease protein|nr:FtsX-like permease family protein [Thiomicrorhabdus sp.]